MKKLLVVLLTVLFILTGCSNGGGSNNGEGGGTYVYAQDGEPATLNPNAIGDDYNYPIVQNLFPRLYKLTNAFTAAPAAYSPAHCRHRARRLRLRPFRIRRRAASSRSRR